MIRSRSSARRFEKRRMAMNLVIFGARQFGIKTTSWRHFGNLLFFGYIVWGITRGGCEAYLVTLTDRCSFLGVSGQRGTIAKSTYEEHLCVVALISIERATQFFPLASYSLVWSPTHCSSSTSRWITTSCTFWIMLKISTSWSSLFSFQCIVTSSSQPIIRNSILLLPCLMMYYFVFAIFLVSLHGD